MLSLSFRVTQAAFHPCDDVRSGQRRRPHRHGGGGGGGRAAGGRAILPAATGGGGAGKVAARGGHPGRGGCRGAVEADGRRAAGGRRRKPGAAMICGGQGGGAARQRLRARTMIRDKCVADKDPKYLDNARSRRLPLFQAAGRHGGVDLCASETAEGRQPSSSSGSAFGLSFTMAATSCTKAAPFCATMCPTTLRLIARLLHICHLPWGLCEHRRVADREGRSLMSMNEKH